MNVDGASAVGTLNQGLRGLHHWLRLRTGHGRLLQVLADLVMDLIEKVIKATWLPAYPLPVVREPELVAEAALCFWHFSITPLYRLLKIRISRLFFGQAAV